MQNSSKLGFALTYSYLCRVNLCNCLEMSGLFRPFIIILTALSIALSSGAAAPEWTDAAGRAAQWPEADYFTGYAVVDYGASGKSASLNEKAARAALRAMALQVTTNPDSWMDDTRGLVNVWSDIYDDAPRRSIHAIAVLRKQDLVDAYIGRIDAVLADAVRTAGDSQRALETGDKHTAFRLNEALLNDINALSGYFDILTVLKGNGFASYQRQKWTEAKTEAENFLRTHSQATKIWLGFDISDPELRNVLEGKLTAWLSDSGCEAVSSRAQADYALHIDGGECTLTEIDGVTYVTADVGATLKRESDGTKIYSDMFNAKGGALTSAKACRKAYENVARKIFDAIKDRLK